MEGRAVRVVSSGGMLQIELIYSDTFNSFNLVPAATTQMRWMQVPSAPQGLAGPSNPIVSRIGPVVGADRYATGNSNVHFFYAYDMAYWILAVTFAILPAFWLWRRVRNRSKLPGLCSVCGYDLRATPDRCPECGTVSPKVEIISS
jgi:hypothetical protein